MYIYIYMLTWLGYIDGSYVIIYSSTMDPMAMFSMRRFPAGPPWPKSIESFSGAWFIWRHYELIQEFLCGKILNRMNRIHMNQWCIPMMYINSISVASIMYPIDVRFSIHMYPRISRWESAGFLGRWSQDSPLTNQGFLWNTKGMVVDGEYDMYNI